MEKKIIFVVREGLAVRNIEGQFTTFNGVGSVTSVLTGLKDTLASIQTNAQGLAQEFVTIYVPDMMNGILSNSIGLYLRNGKTASGKVIEKAELDLYTEVYAMLTERNFNVRLYNIKHVAKEDSVTKTLIKNTWAALDREERKIMLAGKAQVNGNVAVASTSSQPSPEMVAMQQQMAMMQQMMQGFMSLMGGQMPNMNMAGQVPVAPTTTQATAPVVTPDLGQPTALNVDLGATSTEQVVEEYEPEF